MALKTEQNTPGMAQRIIDAWATTPDAATHTGSAAYEHGQHWIICNECGASWSVVDEEPGIDGFGFEQIADGDEDYHR